ncbi:MAG: MFS transporter [Pseudohongiellaceae bacterium]
MKSYIPFVKDHWAPLAFGFLAIFWGNFGQTFFIGLFSASIQQSLALSSSAYGFAYSLATLASAFTIIWAGGLIDRVSLKVYTAAVCLGLAVAAAIMSQVFNLTTLIIGFYGLRLFGQALLPHTGSTTTARAFELNRGKALSIASSGVPAGEIVLPLLGIAMIGSLGWQNTFLTIALVVVFLVLPMMLYVVSCSGLRQSPFRATNTVSSTNSREDTLLNPSARPSPPSSPQPSPQPSPQSPPQSPPKAGGARRALLFDDRYWLALPGLMAGPFIITGIFIHQDFIISSKGWTPAWFAACFVVYGVMHWISSLIAGVLVDRFRAVNLLPYYLLPMAIALLVLAFLEGDWVALALMSLLAMSIGSSPPITGSLWPEIYGISSIGTLRSMNIAIMVFATALSPALYGFLIDQQTSLTWIFGGSAVYLLLACVLFSFSYTARPEKHAIALR